MRHRQPARETGERRSFRQLHPKVVVGIAIGYGAMLAGAWLAFAGSREGAMAVMAATLVFAFFFALPYALYRIGENRLDLSGNEPLGAEPLGAEPLGTRRKPSLGEWCRGSLETWTERCGGLGALVQILTIPVALGVALCALALVFALT